MLKHKLIIDGNAVYEIDDDCMACRQASGQWEAEYEAKRQDHKEELSYSPYGKREKTKEK